MSRYVILSQYLFTFACNDLILAKTTRFYLLHYTIPTDDTGSLQEGNEEDDMLANIAADFLFFKWTNDHLVLQLMVCGTPSFVRSIKKTAMATWWAIVEPKLSNGYRKWASLYEIKWFKELKLSRFTLHRLLQIFGLSQTKEWIESPARVWIPAQQWTSAAMAPKYRAQGSLEGSSTKKKEGHEKQCR